MSNLIFYPSVLFAFSSGLATIVIASLYACNNQIPLYVIGSIGMISSSTYAGSKYLNYDRLKHEHDVSSEYYHSIYNEVIDIQVQRLKSSSFVYFAKHCKQKIELLNEKSPKVPEHVVEKLEKIGVDNYNI
jgi:hypothetical protein